MTDTLDPVIAFHDDALAEDEDAVAHVFKSFVAHELPPARLNSVVSR
jgi:hypothetical protein